MHREAAAAVERGAKHRLSDSRLLSPRQAEAALEDVGFFEDDEDEAMSE